MSSESRRMAQDDLVAMEQNSRLAMLHQNQVFIKRTKNMSEEFEIQ